MDKLKALWASICGLICKPLELLFHSQTRMSWRRVATMGAATCFLPAGYINGEQWVFVACIYIGGDTLEKAMRGLRG
jgi:hypothetical protein